MPFRLGDDVDDFCIKCKRLTNHSIVALMDGDPAKVRCRTCYHEQQWRKGEPPPSKKELKKAALLAEMLQNAPAAEPAPESEAPADANPAPGES